MKVFTKESEAQFSNQIQKNILASNMTMKTAWNSSNNNNNNNIMQRQTWQQHGYCSGSCMGGKVSNLWPVRGFIQTTSAFCRFLYFHQHRHNYYHYHRYHHHYYHDQIISRIIFRRPVAGHRPPQAQKLGNSRQWVFLFNRIHIS